MNENPSKIHPKTLVCFLPPRSLIIIRQQTSAQPTAANLRYRAYINNACDVKSAARDEYWCVVSRFSSTGALIVILDTMYSLFYPFRLSAHSKSRRFCAGSTVLLPSPRYTRHRPVYYSRNRAILSTHPAICQRDIDNPRELVV